MNEKPQINIFAICDRVIFDQLGKPSLLGIFDTIYATSFPTAPSFRLFLQLRAPTGKYQLSLHVGKDGEVQSKIGLDKNIIEVPSDKGSAFFVANIKLSFNEPSEYCFYLYVNDQPVLTCPFLVQLWKVESP